jgi:hypothetical protein
MPSLTADEAGQLKMMQIVLVGLGAGAAAALLLASVVSGSIAAIFLFYLAPLPILIAALGWNHIAGLIAAAVATAAITLRKAYEGILRDQSLIDMLVVAVPPGAAVFSTVTNLFNLWLAARIVKISGRLRRPWPDLASLALPASSSGLLAAAIAGSFLPDLFGILSGAFAASLLMAFAVLGFAVLHAITRGSSSRAVVLAAVYAATIVLGWPLLALSLLGLAEAAFNIRNRVARKRGPPALRP